MPQNSMKSIVYRSLVHCDDPNGVQEINRRSKIRHTQRTSSGLNSSLVHKEERNERAFFSKRPSEELQTPSSFQLLEVSRGAHNLNQMIESWSNGTPIDEQSGDIARDLLRGALDLQESLVMLCKLQEASKFMSNSKRIHELKVEGEEDRFDVGRVESCRFAERSYPQNPRFSIGGSSSRKCTEGLKNVIRESLSRQNLLTVSSTEDSSSFVNHMKYESVSEFPSTSSTQSSMVYSDDINSVDSSVSSSVAQKEKAKSRSVIAKLMGLEEFPTESVQILPKHSYSEKNSNYRRPISDIEIPKAIRKPYFVNREVDRKRRTLKEIIETMQFKGILKRNSHVDRLKFGDNLPQTSSSKHSSDDEIPPIVIMKPLNTERKGYKLGELFRKDEASYSNEEPIKTEAKDEPPNQRFVKEEEYVEPKEFLGKPKTSMKMASKTLPHKDLESKNMGRKLETKREVPTRRLIREDGNLMSNHILRKQRAKETKTTEETTITRTTKGSVAQNHKPHKAEKPNKVVDKIRKTLPPPERRKLVQTETAKASAAARSLDQVRTTSTKTRKLDKGSIIKTDIVAQNHILKRSTNNVSQSSLDQSKKSRTRKPKTINTNNGVKEVGVVCKSKVVSSTTSGLPADQLLRDVQAHRVQFEDYKEIDTTMLAKTTVKTDCPDSSIKFSKESEQMHNKKKSHPTTEIDLKKFFLSSPSFLICAEDRFDIDTNQALGFQATILEDNGIISTRLYFDCANELMEHKARLNKRVPVHPLTKIRPDNPRIHVSLNGLVDEIIDEIEIFRSYNTVDDGEIIVPIDNVLKKLESDLKMKETMGNGGWDLGWKNGFSMSEVDEVVFEMEMEVLDEVIDDFIIDLRF